MLNRVAFHGRRVLVTGHTGFKGSWLALWLHRLGAEVCGYSLGSPTQPCHWDALALKDVRSVQGDIRDQDRLHRCCREFQPELVFHLAAQPLVRRSYRDPVETFSTNVMGTLHVFEVCRAIESVRAIMNVTSDKCYENQEWLWGYRENDPMGGFDPYSASKGCSELLTASYRNAYFHPDQFGTAHHTLVASCRAGNVVGGGDWADDRLVPDLVRSVTSGQPVSIRSPQAIRPWQHVLEPLHGYLKVACELLEGRVSYATAWNFGPQDESSVSVEAIAQYSQRCWDAIRYDIVPQVNQPHEATCLKLDSSRARQQLHWYPVWTWQKTLDRTIQWYKQYYDNKVLNTETDFDEYEREMYRQHA
jgi:CDP-glucose 4,6-dehydratase